MSENKTQLKQKQISVLALHLIFHCFSLFNCCLSVVCSLIKGITLKIQIFPPNSVLFNLSCVLILKLEKQIKFIYYCLSVPVCCFKTGFIVYLYLSVASRRGLLFICTCLSVASRQGLLFICTCLSVALRWGLLFICTCLSVASRQGLFRKMWTCFVLSY